MEISLQIYNYLNDNTFIFVTVISTTSDASLVEIILPVCLQNLTVAQA
jgi:hypothetical protein